MARVLALVPTAGLEAVLVAVDLALDGAPPSGRERRTRYQRARASERGAAAVTWRRRCRC
jgi:hypothetical protein